MGLPGLFSSGDRPSTPSITSGSRFCRSSTISESELLPEYIHDDTQIPCVPPERPDLRELNACLEALTVVFPDVQVEVFRELLSHFDGESRLFVVADALLKNKVKWVKGRWLLPEAQPLLPGRPVPKRDNFRSPEYRTAVRALAWHEFRGLTRSTIHGVLAESNYSYLDARPTLVLLSSKSWRFTISSLFLRRKTPANPEPENHPLVVWRSTGKGSIVPTIRATGSAELDRELYDTLVVPLRRQEQTDKAIKDRVLAVLLNNEEAERAHAMYECACCFTTASFEEMTQCNREGHLVCFRCVQHTIKEAIFGQGWLSSIDQSWGTLKCIAADDGFCEGLISEHQVRRAVTEEDRGQEILQKLNQRLTEHSLLGSNLPLVHCPFCNYAEVDELYVASQDSKLRIKLDNNAFDLAFIILCLGVLPLLLPIVVLSSIVCLALSSRRTYGDYLAYEWQQAVDRHRQRRRGSRFSCQNPDCLRKSCLICSKPWRDIHICNESALVALRTQVEQAMSLAMKRVCPRCNTSFVKEAGCNKLTCPCGYKMCYVCRASVVTDGYRHFCQHFHDPDRDLGSCDQCDRCNLWENEDTERVLREAREEAEKQWMAREKCDLSGPDKAFLDTGVAVGGGRVSVHHLLFGGRLPTIAEFLDVLVETIFE